MFITMGAARSAVFGLYPDRRQLVTSTILTLPSTLFWGEN
jgi:hypothetical protein